MSRRAMGFIFGIVALISAAAFYLAPSSSYASLFLRQTSNATTRAASPVPSAPLLSPPPFVDTRPSPLAASDQTAPPSAYEAPAATSALPPSVADVVSHSSSPSPSPPSPTEPIPRPNIGVPEFTEEELQRALQYPPRCAPPNFLQRGSSDDAGGSSPNSGGASLYHPANASWRRVANCAWPLITQLPNVEQGWCRVFPSAASFDREKEEGNNSSCWAHSSLPDSAFTDKEWIQHHESTRRDELFGNGDAGPATSPFDDRTMPPLPFILFMGHSYTQLLYHAYTTLVVSSMDNATQRQSVHLSKCTNESLDSDLIYNTTTRTAGGQQQGVLLASFRHWSSLGADSFRLVKEELSQNCTATATTESGTSSGGCSNFPSVVVLTGVVWEAFGMDPSQEEVRATVTEVLREARKAFPKTTRIVYYVPHYSHFGWGGCFSPERQVMFRDAVYCAIRTFNSALIGTTAATGTNMVAPESGGIVTLDAFELTATRRIQKAASSSSREEARHDAAQLLPPLYPFSFIGSSSAHHDAWLLARRSRRRERSVDTTSAAVVMDNSNDGIEPLLAPVGDGLHSSPSVAMNVLFRLLRLLRQKRGRSSETMTDSRLLLGTEPRGPGDDPGWVDNVRSTMLPPIDEELAHAAAAASFSPLENASLATNASEPLPKRKEWGDVRLSQRRVGGATCRACFDPNAVRHMGALPPCELLRRRRVAACNGSAHDWVHRSVGRDWYQVPVARVAGSLRLSLSPEEVEGLSRSVAEALACDYHQ